MPIKRTITYVCDCCGRVLEKNAKYHLATVESFNCRTLAMDDIRETFVYCHDCSEYMWKAIQIIPKIREANEADNGKS